MAVTGFVLFVIAAACCTVVAKSTYDSSCPLMTTWGKAQHCCEKNGQSLPDRRNTSIIARVMQEMNDSNLHSVWTIQREILAKRWMWLDGTIDEAAIQESSSTSRETECAYLDLRIKSITRGSCLGSKLGHICSLENCTGCNMGRVAPFACVREGATCYFHFCRNLPWLRAREHCKSYSHVDMDLPILKEQVQKTALEKDKWHCSRFWIGMRTNYTLVETDHPSAEIPNKCGRLKKNEYNLTSCDEPTAWICVGGPSKTMEQEGASHSSTTGITVAVVFSILLVTIIAIMALGFLCKRWYNEIIRDIATPSECMRLLAQNGADLKDRMVKPPWIHDKKYDVILVSTTDHTRDLGPSSVLFIMQLFLKAVDSSLTTCVLDPLKAAFINTDMVSNIIILFPENINIFEKFIDKCPGKISTVITAPCPGGKEDDYTTLMSKAKTNFFIGSKIFEDWKPLHCIDGENLNPELYVPVYGFFELPPSSFETRHKSLVIDLVDTRPSEKVKDILEKLDQIVLERETTAIGLVSSSEEEYLQGNRLKGIDFKQITSKNEVVRIEAGSIWCIISDTQTLTWTSLRPSINGMPQIIGSHTAMAFELDGIPQQFQQELVAGSDFIEHFSKRLDKLTEMPEEMRSDFQSLPMRFLSSPRMFESQRSFLVHCLGDRTAELEVKVCKQKGSPIDLDVMAESLLSSLPIFPRKKHAAKVYTGKKIYDAIINDLGKVVCGKKGDEEHIIELIVYLKDATDRIDIVKKLNNHELGMAFLKVFILRWKELFPDQNVEDLGVEIMVTMQKNTSMDSVRKKTWMKAPAGEVSYLFHKAAEAGAYDVVQNCVEVQKQNVNMKDKDGCTPLISAAMYGHKKVVGYLLKHDADIKQKDKYGRTALIFAADAKEIIMETFESDIDIVDPLLGNEEEEIQDDVEDASNFIAEDENPQDTAILLVKSGAEVHDHDQEGETALVKAATKGYTGLAEVLVDKGAKVDIKNKDGETPLMRAMKDGNERLINLMISKGADVHTTDKKKQTLLMHASRRDDQSSMKELLRRKVNVDRTDQTGKTALIFAAISGHNDAVSILLEANASIDLEDEKGNTALIYAAETGQINVVIILLDRNASMRHMNHEGKTAETLANERNHVDVVNILRKRSGKPEKKIPNVSFEEAMVYGNTGALELILEESPNLLEEESEEGYTPLMRAVQSRQFAVLSLLLRKKANVNHVSSKNGWSAIHIAVYENDFESLEKLLADGNRADVNLESVHGFTPLMVAIVNGGYDMVSEILRKGASLTYEAGEYGRTPLMCALEGNDMKMANCLLDKNAKVDQESEKKGYTPLLWAVAINSCEAVEFLIGERAKVDRASSKTGRSALALAAELGLCDIVTTLLRMGADKRFETTKGETAFMLALNQCNNEMIDHLLDNEFDLEYKSKQLCLTPLLYAIWQNLDLRHLLNKGAMLSAHDEQTGFTPLIFAIKCGNTDAIGSLIDNGADIEQESSKTGKTPLMYAIEGEKTDIIDYLLKRGAEIDHASKKTGLTPLLFALDNSPTRMVKLLLEKGANVESVGQKPLKRNLISNPMAEDGLHGWSVVKAGDSGFAIEGLNPLEMHTLSSIGVKGCTRCWVNSSDWFVKEQTIDLLAEGFTEKVLDKMALNISVSECVAKGCEASSEYYFELTLQDRDKKPLGQPLRKEYPGENMEWVKIEEHGSYWYPGIRYINFRHTGKNTCLGKGCFGYKFTAASVKIDSVHSSPFVNVLKELMERFD